MSRPRFLFRSRSPNAKRCHPVSTRALSSRAPLLPFGEAALNPSPVVAPLHVLPEQFGVDADGWGDHDGHLLGDGDLVHLLLRACLKIDGHRHVEGPVCDMPPARAVRYASATSRSVDVRWLTDARTLRNMDGFQTPKECPSVLAPVSGVGLMGCGRCCRRLAVNRRVRLRWSKVV